MREKTVGMMKLVGSSETILPKKYALGEYMLLLTSLRNTGRSVGKSRMMF